MQRVIVVNRTRRVPFDVTTKVIDTSVPIAKSSVTPPSPAQAALPVAPIVTRVTPRSWIVAVMFFGVAWLLVVPLLVSLPLLGIGASWLFAGILGCVTRHTAINGRVYGLRREVRRH